MWLDEHDSKTLASRFGIDVPAGERVRSAADAVAAAARLAGPVYVKAQSASVSRALAGGIRRVEQPREAGVAFDEVTRKLDVSSARIELAAEPESAEWYAGVALSADGNGFVALASAVGGADFERRRPASVGIDLFAGLAPHQARRLVRDAGIPLAGGAAVVEVLSACYRIVRELDLTLVEVNPLVLVSGRSLALDVRMISDDNAAFRHPEFGELFSTARAEQSREGRMRALGIDYVPLGGDIGVLALGAGLTMHIADELERGGGSPAYFMDATRVAVRDWAALFAGETPTGMVGALREAFRMVGLPQVLLVNFISGGTPVDGLVRGLLAFLEEAGGRTTPIVNVAGNSSGHATRLLREAGIEPSASVGEACESAVRASLLGRE